MVEVREVWKRQLPGAVEALAISLDGDMVLVGGSNGTVSLMARDGSTLWSQPTASEIAALDLSSMGEQLAVGLKNGAVLFLDKAGHIAWRYEAKEPVSSLSLNPAQYRGGHTFADINATP